VVLRSGRKGVDAQCQPSLRDLMANDGAYPTINRWAIFCYMTMHPTAPARRKACVYGELRHHTPVTPPLLLGQCWRVRLETCRLAEKVGF